MGPPLASVQGSPRGEAPRVITTLAGICVMTAAVLCAGAPQARSMRITSPANGAYLMGAVRFTVAFEPAGAIDQVQNVRWFADGKVVCTASVPPYFCEWDAGALVREHLVRAVATLKNGDRLVHSTRSAAVEYAEAVEVDVIQITAVVTEGGRVVWLLKAEDFKLYDEDKPQRLTNFAAENIPSSWWRRST